MQKKTLFFAGVLLCLIAGGWGYYQYQKPRAGLADATAAFQLRAEQLYTEFASDEITASQKYSDKILEVTGRVQVVQASGKLTNILLNGGSVMGGVNCSLLELEQQVKKGEYIKVKGRCTGFLMDVNLAEAVLVKK